MTTHQEYVTNCIELYREANLQPGNRKDGEWNKAHYPHPKCLGGTETILLLREHHAVQGVLQSEEYQHPCIWGWEKPYLNGDLLLLWRKWMAIKAQPAVKYWMEQPYEARSEIGRMGALKQPIEGKIKGGHSASSKVSKEDKVKRLKLMVDSLTPEEIENARIKATNTILSNNPNHFSEMGKKARDLEPYEVKRRRMEKCLDPEVHARALATTNGRKFKCLVTGFISTAGPLTLYQRARGIDTSLREKVITEISTNENETN